MKPGGPESEAGPRRFVRKWLTFHESRPIDPRLHWKFIAVLAATLAGTALLAWINARTQ